jgi:methionyl aminopeptidase
LVDNDILEKYREAGRILIEVKDNAVKKVKVGASLLELAEHIESSIKEKGAGVAFPVNISLNEEAAHATPSKNDKRVFARDLVKLDIGTHIDGYIADTAVTVDLGNNKEIVKASQTALDAAIDVIKAGINTSKISEVIEKTITDFGFNPVVNLTGHGLEQYMQHAPPSILNKRIETGVKLKEGQVVAIEPFTSSGKGRVYEAGHAEIFSLLELKPIRSRDARIVLNEIETFKTLPFAKRWLQGRVDMSLRQLEAAGIIRSYPILKDRGLVSQSEDTVIVTVDGCEVITRATL